MYRNRVASGSAMEEQCQAIFAAKSTTGLPEKVKLKKSDR